MTLTLVEILILAEVYKNGKASKSTLGFNAKSALNDPNLDVKVAVSTIDTLVLKGYLFKDSDFKLELTSKGEDILKDSIKELKDIVWTLPT